MGRVKAMIYLDNKICNSMDAIKNVSSIWREKIKVSNMVYCNYNFN